LNIDRREFIKILPASIAGALATAALVNTNHKVRATVPESLQNRLKAALSTSMHVSLTKEDVLGEGEGSWDSHPRYPSGTLNCMTWLQWVIAKTYSKDEDETKAALDRLRYYRGQVAWGTRKHFIDHWISVEAAPLRQLDLSACDGFLEKTIHLDFNLFKSSHRYGCRLYREDVNVIQVKYIVADSFRKCCDLLRDGHYIVFPVAGANYMKNTVRFTGPMGLVHSLMLRVTRDTARSKLTIINPSTDAGKVIEKDINEYLKGSRSLFDGYTLFTLDQIWDFNASVPEDDATKQIIACERELPCRTRPGI